MRGVPLLDQRARVAARAVVRVAAAFDVLGAIVGAQPFQLRPAHMESRVRHVLVAKVVEGRFVWEVCQIRLHAGGGGGGARKARGVARVGAGGGHGTPCCRPVWIW